jgi:hypothetical protein
MLAALGAADQCEMCARRRASRLRQLMSSLKCPWYPRLVYCHLSLYLKGYGELNETIRMHRPARD